MDKKEIGCNAGKVWHILSNNASWKYDDLKEKSGLKDKELAAAIGWLARENKIELEEEGEDLYIYLCVNVYIG
ncbi:winged helix-turn-helix domain-containing protein [uncultured Bacteroides sp.]|uniref:winged helix-turn-helix domain-containing protein n=1 Tax=uncultured Bacteroides sp. TaxID=162156 RepID=UPI002AAA6BB2|nr:winged helix-turn-helix domain-containing protein [uncultured Bacteroides sp.]